MSKKLNSFKTAVSKRSPELMLALGLGSMVFATVHVFRKSRKVNATIDMAKASIEGIKTDPELSETEKKAETREVVARAAVDVAKAYSPALIATIVGVCCVTKSHNVMKGRLIAVSTAYSGIDKAYSLYKKSARDTVGEKAEQDIVDAAAKASMKPVPKDPAAIFVTGNGDTLCYDTLTDRYFKSDMESIRHALNNLNNMMMTEGYISLNDWYFELGMKGVGLGDDLGWRMDDGLIEITFSSHIADNGQPCLCVNYMRHPVFEFSDLY